ncbi:MAG: alpha/beta hydrolase [Lentisphaeraceae bacterium]|nr:alpha/beta hydrolase [Lentisphaeraceae bacterium]
MKFLVCLLFLSSFLSAEPPIKTPKPDLKMALWPDRPLKTMEEEGFKYSHIIKVTKVESPSLELYKSKSAKESAPAVVIFPGGGYSILAYDLEGTEIATWLNSIGFHAIVVKYTVPGNKRMEALKDAQRSMGIVRSKASEWGINPKQIGVLGFSAGGHLTAHVSTSYKERAYDKVDKSDDVSCRPDFSVLVYPAYLFTKEDKYKLPEEIKVDANTPPAFTVQTLDDRRLIDSAFNYTRALKNAKVDAELHLYAKGGHGYGMRPTDKPVSKWAELCTVWLKNLTK